MSFPLNKEQKTAVEILDGPAMVVAGAGTGKTRVIVERIAKLINSGIDRNNILALTFTEKAAQEMVDRVSDILEGSYGVDLNIHTFNAFGELTLKEFAFEAGLSGNLKLLGEVGKLVFLKENIDELELEYFSPVSSPDGQLSNLASYFSLLKQQLITPEAYIEYAQKLPSGTQEEKLDKTRELELASSYRTYQKLCRANGFIDYDDQIYLLVEVLENRPNILSRLQERYQYILVDEFQDTNPMQSRLLDLLAAKHSNLMVVGDDDQSIYGWRGATLSNILDFTKRYPKAQEITLIKNYRTTQPILDSAYQLIQHNNPERLEVINKLDKKLISDEVEGQSPEIKRFSSINAELSWIVSDIEQRIKDGQNPGSIAVLARRNLGARRVHELLEANGIQHILAGVNSDLYKHPAVSNMIEVLRSVADPHDDTSLYHALTGPLFSLDAKQIGKLIAKTKKTHASLFDALSSEEDDSINKAVELITSWREVAPLKSVGHLSYQILDETGLKDKYYIEAEESTEGALAVQALGQWFNTLWEFERVSDVASVQSYMDNINVLRSAGETLEDGTLLISDSVVNVMSVHKAKGLEWQTVYIHDCTEFSFPMKSFGSSLSVPEQLSMTSAADDHMAEERRLMYVAATRAKSELILTFSDTHTGTTPRKPSRFIEEMVGEMELASKIGDEDTETLEQFSPASHSTEKVHLPAKMLRGDSLVLTASQIGDYMRCPQDFYYRHILNVPAVPNPNNKIGTLLHNALEEVNKSIINKSEPPKLETLVKKIESELPEEGYLTKKQRERAHKQAVKSFKTAYKKQLEDANVVQSELPFKVSVPGSRLIISGRIDAVLDTEHGIEIRDYKSSTNATTPEKAKRSATSSQQLAIYALAWRQIHEEMPAFLSLDFVQTGQIGRVKKRESTLDNLEKKLSLAAENIVSGNFEPGKRHDYCRHPVEN